jgi:hypothetical protein
MINSTRSLLYTTKNKSFIVAERGVVCATLFAIAI